MKDINLIKPYTIVHVGTEHVKEFVRQLYEYEYCWGVDAPIEQALEAADLYSQSFRFGEETSILIARKHKFSFVSASDPLINRTKCVFMEYTELPEVRVISFDDFDNFL